MFVPIINAQAPVNQQNTIKELKSLPLQNQQCLRQMYDQLPNDLKKVFDTLFNSESKSVELLELLPFREKKSQFAICNRQLKTTQICFKCYDCMLHEGNLICAECFQEGNHKNHRYVKMRDMGTCDCGNENIMKKNGFCAKHWRDSALQEELIEVGEKIAFELYMKQMFIWIFVICSKLNLHLGVFYMVHFLRYLVRLNKDSLIYNKLTTSLLFHDKASIMSEVFQIVLGQSRFQKDLTKILIELLQVMYPCQQFKQALLPLMIRIYNKTEGFQSSEFEKILIILLSDSVTVKKAMEGVSQTLNPSRRVFNAHKYYSHLLMIQYFKPEVAQLFLLPLLFDSCIPSPMSAEVQSKCKQGIEVFLSFLNENIQQQFLYYQASIVAVRMINTKALLCRMMTNYCKVICRLNFQENKIVLMPHRIFALLVFKYFEFDYRRMSLKELGEVMGLKKEETYNFIRCYLWQLIGCLQQFSLDIVRNTYFYNYRIIYLKQESQVIVIDYLAIKIIAYLFLNDKQPKQFSTLLLNLYNHEKELYKKDDKEKQRDHFFKWNKLLEVMVEIVYSPTVQLTNCLFLKEEKRMERQGKEVLSRIMKKVGKLTMSELELIQKHIFLGECPESWKGEVLRLNKETEKLEKIENQSSESVQEMHFDIMPSLVHTTLNHFMTNEKKANIVLSEEQKGLGETILNFMFVDNLLLSQLQFLRKNFELEEVFKNILEIVRVTKVIGQLNVPGVRFEQVYNQCYQIVERYLEVEEYQNNPTLIEKTKEFIVELDKSIEGSNFHQQEGKFDKSRERKKALQNLKKERLMKQKKMRQNQLLFMAKVQNKQPLQYSPEQQQQCLICKQKDGKSKLCYLSKLRLNNILFDQNNFKEKQVIFYSCFHTVHFQCFRQQTNNKITIACPLCQAACNIVLPRSSRIAQAEFMSIYNYILFIFEKILKEKIKGIAVYAYMFFGYVGLRGLKKEQFVSEKEVELCRSLQLLAEYQLRIHHQLKKQLMEPYLKLEEKEENQKENKIKRCLVMMAKFMLDFSELVEAKLQEEFINCTQSYLYEFINILNKDSSSKIIRFLLKIIHNQSFQQFGQLYSTQQIETETVISSFQPLPLSLEQFFKLRDESRCQKNYSHTSTICMLCGQQVCSDCKQLQPHAQKKHLTQSLYFNLQTGGIIYSHIITDISMHSLFVNKLGTIWHPQFESKQFFLDTKTVNEVEAALQNGNLFYYLTHHFLGLKGRAIADII